MNSRKLPLVLLATGIALAGCTTTTQQQTRTAVPDVLPSGKEGNRILDSRMRNDLSYIEGLQSRIKALNDKGIPVEDYNLSRAQCWLSFGLEEYHENDRTGIIETALTESANIIGALEQAREPEATKSPVATSEILREDLWARLKALQTSPWRSCASAATGCLEVILNEAGHEYRETGWRHARGTIAEAERMVAEAESRTAACAQPPPQPVAVASTDDDRDGVPNNDDRCPNTPPPARVDATGCVLTDEIKLPGVNFDTDRASLKAQSFAVLDGAVATLKLNPDLRIEVAGHTDNRASDAHNLDLSQRRAETVRGYLQEHGASNVLGAKGYGESSPLDTNDTVAGRAANRRVVLKILKE